MRDVIRIQHVCGCYTHWAAHQWADQMHTLDRVRSAPCPECRERRAAIERTATRMIDFYGSPERALSRVGAISTDLERSTPFWGGVVDRLLYLVCCRREESCEPW